MSPSVSVRLLLTQSDERLVGYARAGHERAFEALVQRYRRQLHSYCRRLLLSEERAEDALQQALLQAWVALRDGTEVHDVRPWLYRIVHNAAINALRVSGYDYCTLNESLSGADAPQADLDRRIAVREALAGLAALPEMQREALLRTALEGHSHEQVARDLGVSQPAVRGLIYRARTALRAAAGAIVPPPLLGWALEAGTRGTPALEQVAGLGAGGGSAGLASLVVKGSAVAVTAGALAGGIVAAHTHKPKRQPQLVIAHPNARASDAERSPSPPAPGTGASARPAAFTQPSRASHKGRTTGGGDRSTRASDRLGHRRAPERVHTPRTPAPAPTWTPHGDGGGQQGEGSRPSFGAHYDRHGEGSGGPGSHDGGAIEGSAGSTSHDSRVESSGGSYSHDNQVEDSASSTSHEGHDALSQESGDREQHDGSSGGEGETSQRTGVGSSQEARSPGESGGQDGFGGSNGPRR
ncbi:MAG TPA: sigma-70 family RNA polymerase sigma factor [Solirubrobacteraceae bacterium]|nr:sigma-70 family RNA polymerase sigma factor [Solirubrobacteraceae bacterium]